MYTENSWKSAIIAAGLDQLKAQYGCPIVNTYTTSGITEILETLNFVITNISQDDVFPYIVEEYKKYHYVKEPWFNTMPSAVFDALEKNLGWYLLLTASLE